MTTIATSKLPTYVQQKQRRTNIKCKRRKNIFKKAMELKSLCGLEMLIIFRDTEFNKVQVYNTSPDSIFPSGEVA